MTSEELDAIEARSDAGFRPSPAEGLALVAEVRRLRAENAYLAPRQRAGQRIFNAVHALDPVFADDMRATDADPFHDDERCVRFLSLWVERMDDRRRAGERSIPDPLCARCGQGVACLEGCCSGVGPDGYLRHNECMEVSRG